jgi:hypothetical protein
MRRKSFFSATNRAAVYVAQADTLQLSAVIILASMANFIEVYAIVIPINNGHSET